MKRYTIRKRVITLSQYNKKQVYEYYDTLREVRRKVSKRKDRQLTSKEKNDYVFRTMAWKRNYQDSFDAELRWL